MKKILKICTIIAIVFSTMVFTPENEDIAAKISGDYSYEILTEDTVEITNYNGSAKELVIPKEIDGYTVTRIGYGAFSECKSLEEVSIPDTVITLGNYAFSQCIQLKKINIPDSVVSLGQNTFNGCNSLTFIEIPKDIKSISYGTFFDCINLKTIEIPEGVQTIGEMAFSGCKSLEEINLPSSLMNINGDAFSRCINLSEVIIPNGVTTVGTSAFSGCISLKNISIPDTVTGIGQSAFQDCVSLESINLPNSIQAIGYSAFSGCSSLKQVNIPSSLVNIGNAMFSGCSSLESITIPNTIKSIGENAFSGCVGLKSIVIPDSVTEIGASAFSNCSELESVKLSNNLKIVETSLFRYCNKLDSIIVPNGVREIKATAFADCLNLRSVILPSSISEEMGSRIFSNCPKLIVSVVNGSLAHTYVRRNEIPFQLIVDGINLDVANLNLKVNETRKFNAILSPYTIVENNKLTWISSNSSIVSVDANGNARGVSVGTATISVKTANGLTATATVNVDDVKIPITSISLNKSEITMKKENTESLLASITPQTTTESKTLEWKSSNEEIVTVSSTGKMTAKSPGDAIITVTASNGLSATCKIKVISEIKTVSLNFTSLTMDADTTQSLRATINPSDTTDDKSLTWISSNTKFASVDQNGIVTAIAKGTATITVVTSNGKKAECKITINEPEIVVPITSVNLNKNETTIEKGKNETLIATINPSNTTEDTKLNWKSSSEEVATVKDGVVTALSDGVATITVTTTNGKTATCKVEVFSIQMDKLDALIEQATDKEALDYTITSYATLQNALVSAKETRAKMGVTQTEIDSEVDRLTTALSGLIERASSSALQTFVEVVEDCRTLENDYTPEVYEPMKNLIILSEQILIKGEGNISASEVNEMILQLSLAKESLIIDGMIDVLKVTIQSANDILDGDISGFTPEKIEVLRKAVFEAEEIIISGSRDIDKIQNATKDLRKAIDGLEELGDKTILLELVGYVDSLSETAFTQSSWSDLQAKIKTVNEVLSNPNATSAEVATAYKQLIDAIVNLQPALDTSALVFQIDAAESILLNKDRYVASSIKGLDVLLKDAQTLLMNEKTTQTKIDEMTKNLTKAVLKARLKAN